MTFTVEQEDIFSIVKEHIENKQDLLLKVESVAGSGKTSTLVEIANLLPASAHNLYLAYNKSIATEAATKFPGNTECKTTHSLAYAPIIKHGLTMGGEEGPKRTIETFTGRSITEKVSYDTKALVIKELEKFFLSDSVDIYNYFNENTEANKLSILYFQRMVNNDI